MITLEALNAAEAGGFVAALDGVFEHARVVAERAAAGRPFPTLAVLHAALMREVREAAEPEIVEFLRHHPELEAGKLAGGLTADSAAEQAGLGMQAAEGAAALPALNRGYRERFGFPFIVCVARHTAADVLRQLQARAGRSRDEELAAALDEVSRITRLRLLARVSGPGAPAVAGSLSTHALDLQAGRPAGALRVILRQEGRTVAEAATDADGRVGGGLLPPGPLRQGRYELLFDAGAYFAARGVGTFYDTVPIRFVIAEAEGRYHIPLLLAPFGYSTYRGS